MFSTLMRNRINSCKMLYISDIAIIYRGGGNLLDYYLEKRQ